METATRPPPSGTNNSNSASGRGKEHLQWSEAVWKALDQALMKELATTRVLSKFFPQFHVHKKEMSVVSDIVTVPVAGAADPALFIDESDTTRIQEYFATFKLSKAQVESEEDQEMKFSHQTEANNPHELSGTDHHPQHAGPYHRASTSVSLTTQIGNVLAQAEDLILINGQNAVANSALFQGANAIVQSNDPLLQSHLDYGLANINPTPSGGGGPDITVNPAAGALGLVSNTQVIVVHPTVAAAAGAPPLYRENSLNAVAQGVTVLQGFSHYEHYALVLNTLPYADLHEALPTTLIQPVIPIAELVKAGVHGTGTMPPLAAPAGGGNGLPVSLNGVKLPAAGLSNWGAATQVLYTGLLLSLSGNNMDIVRGRMLDTMDAVVNFETKAAGGQHYFRAVQRFALRLKRRDAVILFLFVDTVD
jgi:hypothetical protein